MEANKSADGVLALEKAVATLQQEAREVDGEFERKLSEVEADAAVIQAVGPSLPCLVLFLVDFWTSPHDYCLVFFRHLRKLRQSMPRLAGQGWSCRRC